MSFQCVNGSDQQFLLNCLVLICPLGRISLPDLLSSENELKTRKILWGSVVLSLVLVLFALSFYEWGKGTTPGQTVSIDLTCAKLCQAIYSKRTGLELENELKNFGFDKVTCNEKGNNRVAVCSNNKHVVIVFRGSDNARNWITNANINYQDVPNGTVHKGFYQASQLFHEDLIDQIADHGGKTKPIYTTGHSLGGAMATIFSYLSTVQGDAKVHELITFGQPLALDRNVAKTVNDLFQTRYRRFVNETDIVTRLIPTFFHAGQRVHLTTNQASISEPSIRFKGIDGNAVLTESEFLQLKKQLAVGGKGDEVSSVQARNPVRVLANHSMAGYVSKVQKYLKEPSSSHSVESKSNEELDLGADESHYRNGGKLNPGNLTASNVAKEIRFVPQSGHGRPIAFVGVDEESGIVVSKDVDSEICIWELNSGRQIRRLVGAKALGELGFLPRLFAVVLAEREFRNNQAVAVKAVNVAWSLETGERIEHKVDVDDLEKIRFLNISRFEAFQPIKLSGNSNVSFRFEKQSGIVVEDLQTGRMLFSTGRCSRISRAGDNLIYLGDTTNSQFKPNEFAILRASSPTKPVVFSGIQDSSATAFATGRKRLNLSVAWWLNRISAGAPDECCRPPYTLTTLEQNKVRLGQAKDLKRAMPFVFSPAISGAGRYVAARADSRPAKVSVRRLKDGDELLQTKEDAECFAFSGSDQLAIGFVGLPGLLIYELANDGNSFEVAKTVNRSEYIRAPFIAFSPDSKFISTGLQTWNLDSEKPELVWQCKNVAFPGCCAFSENCRYFAVQTIDTKEKSGVVVSVYDIENEFAIIEKKAVGGSLEDIAFSPTNSELFAIVDSLGNLVVWEVGEPNPVCEYKTGRLAAVNGIEFDETGRYIVAFGMTNSGFIFDLENKKRLMELEVRSSGEWIVSCEEGVFNTSNLGRSDLGSWVIEDEPLRPLPPEIFQRTNFEPRLLTKRITGQQIPIRSISELNRAQPKVDILDVVDVDSPSGNVEVRVKVSGVSSESSDSGQLQDKPSEVYDLRLFRDGQLVGQYPLESTNAALPTIAQSDSDREQWRKSSLVCEADESEIATFPVRLPRNRPVGEPIEFTAYAFNRDRVKSVTAKESHPIPAGLKRVIPTAFVVGVGVDVYQGEVVGDLDYAAADARLLLSDLVPRFVKLGYRIDETALISTKPTSDANCKRPVESPASKKNIRGAIERIQKSACPDDIVMLCFSSHGYASEDGMFYIFPHDLGKDRLKSVSELDADDRKQFLKTRCVSSDELSVWLRDVDAGEFVMIVDTCHAAAAIDGGDFKPGPMGNKGLGQLAYDKGMRILTASQAGDVALESKKIKHGLLTYALVTEGLKSGEADADGDAQIDLNEWLSYAECRVPRLFEEILTETFESKSTEHRVLPVVSSTLKAHESKRRGFTITPAVQTPRLFQFRTIKETLFFAE